MPGGTAVEDVLREAARRRPLSPAAVAALRAESLSAGAGKVAFVEALNELESARDEFFDGRHNR